MYLGFWYFENYLNDAILKLIYRLGVKTTTLKAKSLALAFKAKDLASFVYHWLSRYLVAPTDK